MKKILKFKKIMKIDIYESIMREIFINIFRILV